MCLLETIFHEATGVADVFLMPFPVELPEFLVGDHSGYLTVRWFEEFPLAIF